MRAVLISVQPYPCSQIASGAKKDEVRKTIPKLETPFKCFIYCTRRDNMGLLDDTPPLVLNKRICNGMVIGEFTCIGFDEFTPTERGVSFKRVEALHDACLSLAKIRAYLNGKTGYGWRISDLVIYDKPKPLSEFCIEDKAPCPNRERVYQNPDFNPTGGLIYGGNYCIERHDWCARCKTKPLTRPPQSWCYVEVVNNA